MIRQDNTPGSPLLCRVGQARKYTEVRVPTAYGGADDGGCHSSDGGLPLCVLIQRVGDTFQAATSTSGSPTRSCRAATSVSLSGRKPGRSGRQLGLPGHRATAKISVVSIGAPASPWCHRRHHRRAPQVGTAKTSATPALVGNQSLPRPPGPHRAPAPASGRQRPPPTRRGRSTISSTMSGSRSPETARSAPR